MTIVHVQSGWDHGGKESWSRVELLEGLCLTPGQQPGCPNFRVWCWGLAIITPVWYPQPLQSGSPGLLSSITGAFELSAPLLLVD